MIFLVVGWMFVWEEILDGNHGNLGWESWKHQFSRDVFCFRVVGPLPNDLYKWLINGGYEPHTNYRMIDLFLGDVFFSGDVVFTISGNDFIRLFFGGERLYIESIPHPGYQWPKI